MKHLALCSVIFSALTIVSHAAPALTGGSYSTNPRYAAIVKIRTAFGSTRERASCTGTFISPRHILTSGHCVMDSSKGAAMLPSKIDFSTFPKNDLFWDPNTVEFPHVKFHVNPAYAAHPKSTNEQDIGIIEFERPMSTTFLKLADIGATTTHAVTVAGYGCDKKEDKWSTDFKIGTVEISSVENFLKLKPSAVEFCEGDSGGPAMIETSDGIRVVGISSYVNLVKGFLGLSKDRVVRVDSGAPARAWVQKILATDSFK